MKKTLAFGIGLCVALSACASPKGRIVQGLQIFGMPSRPAHCVADEMGRELSGNQLTAVADLLDGARRAGDIEPNRRNIRHGIDIITRASDRAVANTVIRAGVACLILG